MSFPHHSSLLPFRPVAVYKKMRGVEVLRADAAFGRVHIILRLINDGQEIFGGERREIADVVITAR